MFKWAVKQLSDDVVVAPDERLPWPQTVALSVQHVVAMFGATVLAPLLMGLDPNVANTNARTLSSAGYTDLEVYLQELSASRITGWVL